MRAPCSCSSNVRALRTPRSCSTTAPGRLWRRSADVWMASRWRWRWRRRACRCWVSKNCRSGWTNASGCSPEASVRRCRASARCTPHSTGVSACWRNASAWCSVAWRSLQAASRWKPQRQWQPMVRLTNSKSSTVWQAWWRSRSSPRTPALRRRGIDCSRQRARTHWKNWPKRRKQRASKLFTRAIFAGFSRRPMTIGPGFPMLTYAHATVRRSTICVQPSIGRLGRMAMSKRAWRCWAHHDFCGRCCHWASKRRSGWTWQSAGCHLPRQRWSSSHSGSDSV